MSQFRSYKNTVLTKRYLLKPLITTKCDRIDNRIDPVIDTSANRDRYLEMETGLLGATDLNC